MRNLAVAKGSKAVHPIGHPISHSTNSGFALPPPASNRPFGVILTLQLSGMYDLASCMGEPLFFPSLRVGVGKNANSLRGSRTSTPAAITPAIAFMSSTAFSYPGVPRLGKNPYPVPDRGGAELGRGETRPFRIVPERVKVL